MVKCIAGIDVSKDHLDVANSGQGYLGQFSSDPPGRRELIRRLTEAAVECVVLEATGGYERQIMLELGEAGFRVIRVNPRQMRNFARAIGRSAKTDAIDAQCLVEYGLVVRDRGHELPDAELVKISELLSRRLQLVEMHSAESNRSAQMLDEQAKRCRTHPHGAQGGAGHR